MSLFSPYHTTTNETVEPFSTKMHRIKSSVKTEGFDNGLVWTAKTETSENTSLDASIFGDSGAVPKCISVDGS